MRRTGRRPVKRVAWVALARWAAGIIFVVFGITKFSGHAAELASFRHYPLPAPDAFVYLVGVIELGGGLLLLVGLVTRLAAAALAADMMGAILVSGLARGELISLTLAPVLLAVMLGLIGLGAGPWSLDRRIAGVLPGWTQKRSPSRPAQSHQ
jgi:putative oxidoreductase